MKIRKSGIHNVKAGSNVIIVEPCNLYNCVIGNDVFIGPFVEIQSDGNIGSRTRIQSHSFICELVRIGEDCTIAHSVNFINDTYSLGTPAKGNRNLWKKTTIGDRVVIGSNATLLPVSVCSNVIIGAGSVVTKDITVAGVYVGNPAKFLRPYSTD